MKMRYMIVLVLFCAAYIAGGCAQPPCSKGSCHATLPTVTDPMKGINAEERKINREQKDEQAMREDA